MKTRKEVTHTPGPWRFKNDDSVLTDPGEVTALVGANGNNVLTADTGGFACESDPYGTYPIIVASDADWALIKAAPQLAEVVAAVAKWDRRNNMDALKEMARVAIEAAGINH